MDEAVELGPGYHLVVSRLLPYKNVDQVVEAFRGLPERLLVIGAGPLLEELRAAGADDIYPPGTVIANAAGRLVDALRERAAGTDG